MRLFYSQKQIGDVDELAVQWAEELPARFYETNDIRKFSKEVVEAMWEPLGLEAGGNRRRASKGIKEASIRAIYNVMTREFPAGTVNPF